MEAGICYIKKEYLLAESSGAEASAEVGNLNESKRKHPQDCDADDAAAQQSKRNGGFKKERKRGQNKHRPVYKDDRTQHLCHSLVNGPGGPPCAVPNCRYVHDLDAYLANKGDDLGAECIVYKQKGFCVRGVTCRYAKAHTDADGKNIQAAHYDEQSAQTTCNGISSDLQIRLRKHDYDFSRSKALITEAEKLRAAHKQQQTEPRIGSAIDNTTTGRDAELKPVVDFREKLLLSPLTTVGNLPFRRICKEFGADITCGEMACVVPMLKGLTQEWALTKRHQSEDVFGVQVCGNNPNLIAQATQLLHETAQVDFVDLNIGCPIDLIYQQGGGSALMRRTNILELTVRSCALISPQLPFTVKMRTGVYADKSVAHDLLPLVEQWGASAVTLHGRSREQRYTKSANWSYIEQCAAQAKNMPVIGNGDILSYQDYQERRALAPHVSSVMIGRGALIKPWIFQEIKTQKTWQPTSTERFELLRKYCNYGMEHWGSDTKGVENTRRFLLEWQSFLYRYIPDELLVDPPQKINARPQKYRGRDEMETLLSSPNSVDWVRLSEMLLGPVPQGFNFVPKHKANAY